MTVRLLVTGFTPFPGAPVNPTEHLVSHFRDNPPCAGSDAECRFTVLPVDYGRAVPALEEACADFEPHVALHFGLASEASGFRLERLARNEIDPSNPDNTGKRPVARPIRHDAPHAPSTLPLARIAGGLESQGHRIEWSDDAGGYLCNYVFFHSATGLCRGLRAPMSGFIHVGPVNIPGAAIQDAVMDFKELLKGAELILEICIDEARKLRTRR